MTSSLFGRWLVPVLLVLRHFFGAIGDVFVGCWSEAFPALAVTPRQPIESETEVQYSGRLRSRVTAFVDRVANRMDNRWSAGVGLRLAV
jgi:hypothetical protein